MLYFAHQLVWPPASAYTGDMQRRSDLSVFKYLDYRAFLRDWYLARKQGRSTISLRAFSKKAGFRSSNLLKLVMDGDRNLTDESATQFAVGLGLNKQETAFFRRLVTYTQATKPDEKDAAYRQLVQSKKFSELKPIARDAYDYYSTWYHPVVRELVTATACDGTPEWLAARIRPEVTVAQIRKSLELLERLGFIARSPRGRWIQTTPLVTTGPESTEHVLLQYHRALLEITMQRLGETRPADRDVSALTLGVSADQWPVLKQRLQEFRREILHLVSTERHPEIVLSLTTQLLPLAQTKGGE